MVNIIYVQIGFQAGEYSWEYVLEIYIYIGFNAA